ncbi:MAG: FecR family protein [Bacteroidia bacterium]
MKTYDHILSEYFSGNGSQEDRELVEGLLKTSAEFKVEYEAYAQIWELTKQLSHDDSSMEESWNDFKAIVKAPTKVFGFDWLKVAASILVLAAFSVGIYLTSDNYTSYTTEEQMLELDLVDRSSVSLNVNSELISLKGYGERHREVELNGEAHFDIAKSEHPFVIHVNGGDIEVLGTKFNLFNLKNSDYFAVDLYEGKVVFIADDGEKQHLSADQRLEFNGKELSIMEISSSALSWVDAKEIRCQNMSLEQILLEIQKQYNVTFDVHKKWLKERYTISLPKDNLESCVELISELTDLNFQLKGSIISVK